MLPPSFSSGSDRSAVPRRPGIERRETALKQAQDGTEAAMLLALLQTHNPTAQGSEPKLHSLAGNVHDQSWPSTAFCMAGDNTAEGPEDTTVPMADVLLPLCNSSMSADSRQSCSPGPSWKRDRHEQLADDLDEEAKVTSRRARNREAARRTRAKRMDTIASLSNEVQLLGSINQGLSLQLQRAVHQVDAMGQENDLLRRILIAHAEEMTEAENVSDNICTLAGDLLQLLTQGQLADKQPDLHTSRD
ncbi:hypothetical protein WJX79_010387 [Trebouxia sp. C0005]